MTDPDRLSLARAHRAQGNADTEQALQDAIAQGAHYHLPDGKTCRSLPRALGAWLDAAAPRRGRPPTRPEGARKVGLVLSPAAAAAWDAHEGDRSAWVSRLIERDATR